jgi:GTPase SAR1 family protein
MAVKIIEEDNTFEGLKSKKSTQRLNQIDRIREIGVGNHISLPQLVVCGDQSAGKSSVLERITGIPFPRQDGVCTKFATEIILRHDTETSRITATIIPASARSEADKVLLRDYRKELDDFAELPGVISEAASLMRIRGHGVNEGPAFAADVLRIEVVGDTGLHLTVVDLPGLIAVENDEQTEEDIALVDTIVDTYLRDSRTIILAVVQATNDIANQSIIRRARKFDMDGQRTVGIITKADLINKGTEGRIARLAKNEDTIKLKLGFYLLKNPSPSQLVLGMSRSEQIREELEFFSSSSWKEHRLNPTRVGIIALQQFLQELHSKHIEKELPMVRMDIIALLKETDGSLTRLGYERQTPGDIRTFLTTLSMKFNSLTQAAIDGNYHWTEGDFFAGSSEGSSTRLRADIHCVNGRFSTYMRDKGHLRKLCSDSEPVVGSESDVDSEEEGEVLRVAKQEVEDWVKRV